MAVTTARLNSAWGSDELLQLVQVWEEVVAVPRDRLALLPVERSALHERFCAVTGSTRRSLSSVTRQHHRLCTAYHLIVDTNVKSKADGTPSWFDLPPAQQHELRRLHAKKEKGMTAVTPELFRELERICDPAAENKETTVTPKDAKAKAKAKAKGGRPKKVKTPVAASDDKVTESPRYNWTQQDWLLFVDAWKEAVDEFVDYGNDAGETVKLPNWLIRQRFVALGGSEEVTVGSITAKKRCVIHAFNFVRDCVAGLRDLDGSDWFKLTFNERYRWQRKLIGPKSSQRLGCELGQATYNKIALIMEKEELLATVTGHKRKRTPKRARKASVSSESSLDESMRSATPPLSDEEMTASEDTPRRVGSLEPRAMEDGEPSYVDEKVVESLLDAQNARFEQLMHDLREERMEERKQNQAMLLEILHQRSPPEDQQQNVSYMEALVSKQQEQLMDLFVQMQKERQQEREEFHAMLRQVCSSARP